MASEKCINTSWLLVRISLGFTMLWAFLDKGFGLGFKTCKDATTGAVDVMCSKAYFAFDGGSPTTGFLKGASGPLGTLFQKLAGLGIVDVLYLLGMLGIGVALIAGAGLRIAGYSGAAIMIMMYLAAFAPANNPIFDDHIVYGTVFLLLAITGPGVADKFGLGSWWRSQSFVKDRQWLW